MALWVVVAVGASHGVPVLHGAMTALPLVTIAAYYRYLDASWIFACVVLAAMFVDRVETMKATDRHRVATAASVIVVGLVGIGLFFAWTVLTEVSQAGPRQQLPVILSLSAGAGLLGLFLVSVRQRWSATACAWLAVLEGAACFMLPLASIPSFAGVDRELIAFLRTHVGLQRYAIASGTGLSANFGSIYGIPAMNYDDLPVPARTARFVTSRLDATNDGVIFAHTAPPANEADRRDKRSRFAAALSGYAQAGVRYVLSTDDFTSEPAYKLASGNPAPVALRAGQALTVEIDGVATAHTVGAVSVLIGTYFGASDGNLRVTLCQDLRCATGTAQLAGARDNAKLLVALDAPIVVATTAPARLTIAKDGGVRNVALWTQPAAEADARVGEGAAPADHVPVVEWIEATNPLPVLRTATTNVFQLSDARSYVSAPGCRLDAISHDRLRANCAGPSQLLRLEVFMDGWMARVNGADTPIVPIEDVFQGVDLPAGDSVVEFTYAPWGLRPSFPVALGALALCLTVLSRPYWMRRGRPPQ